MDDVPVRLTPASAEEGVLRSACDTLFRPWTSNSSPGAAVAVRHHGQTVFQACYGMAELAFGIPIDNRTVMRIGSQTKQFTVLLALMLEADGLLSMRDDVRRYLPWLPEYPAPIPLWRLASNTGGQRDFLEATVYSGSSIQAPSTREMARRVIARQREVNFAPGQAMVYCNTGFFLLSEIVEQVSGRSFNELLAARITGPLGMPDTRLMPQDGAILPLLAGHHARGPDGAWRRAQWGVVLGGEGGMVSTLDDMIRWQANLEQPAIGTAEMFRRMETPVRYSNGHLAQYGLGLISAEYRGLRAVGHGGTVAGGKSESMRFPDQAFGVVILGNCDDLPTFSLARRIADAALGPQMYSPVHDHLDAGTFRLVGGDDVFEIAERHGAPVLVNGGGAVPLEQLAGNRFQPERGIQHLQFSQHGDELAATFCGQAQRYRRVRQGGVLPASPRGRFHSEAAGVTAEIDELVLRLGSDIGVSEMALTHYAEDLWLARPGTGPGGPGRPWTFVLRADADAVVLTSERTCGLRLTRRTSG